MGKIADEPATMTAKVHHAPTSEQLRIAQLLGDKAEDNAAMREKCQKVVETTGCSETMALIALHDCNNCIEDAVIKILDGSPEQGEWTVQEGRKARKQQGYSIKDNGTPSNEDINDEFDDINNAKSLRRSAGGGTIGTGGLSHRSRSGGPPRLRGRGGGPASRGQGSRRRVGGNENNEPAAANVHFDEHSSELSRKPGRSRGGGIGGERGRGRGGGARGGGYAGGGGVGRRHMAEQPFDGGMSTWTSEAESNTWDNSMANNKWPNNNHQPQPPAMDEWKGANVPNSTNKNVSSANSNTWDNSMAQSVINTSGKAMVAQPSANHIDEWTPDDWGGEEDWTSMKGRVFTSSTNMVQQHSSSVQPSSNSTFSSKVADVRTSDPTGIPSHLRGESIDVKSLFGQKPNGDVNINDVSSASASWSKQATDTLKNELGIGKVVSPSIEQSNQVISRDSRPFGKPAAAKVEMPSSGPGMGGLIDVEFGEFPTKLRGNGDETSALFEYGSTAGFNSSDLTALPAQSTKDQSGKNVSMVYHGAPVKKDSQLNGADILLSSVAQSSAKDNVVNQSKQTDMLSSSYPNAANTFISQDHQNQFPSRSSSLLVTNQPQKASSGLPPGLPTVGQTQRSYLPNNTGVPPSTGINESVVSQQLAKEPNLGTSPATIQSGQNLVSGLSFNQNATRTTTAVTTASKPQVNQTVINPAANPSFQSLHAVAPNIFYDQNYLNALGILSPPGIFPFDLSSLGQVPPLANNVTTLRDVTGLGAGDVKQQYNRLDSGLSGASNTVNAPPGLAPPTANNAEQAAQLITPAAAIQYSLMNTMQAPYFPFILPTVTNSTASTVSSGNQYAKNSVFSPVYYPGTNAELQMQLDYSKNVYGVPAGQSKPAAASNISLNASDVNSKAYPPGLKTAFDSKSFQNTTAMATPPPAIGNVGYPPTAAIHSSSAYGAYPGFLPHVGMNMMPPNIAQPTSLTTNDGQRPSSGQVNKNPALYAQQKYWPS